MSKFNPTEFGQFVARRTKEMIAAAIAPILEQVKGLPTLQEQVIRLDERIKAMPAPKDGKDGIDGKSVTLEEVQPLIEQVVKSIPIPKDGKDGIDGKSITVDEVRHIIDKAVASLPPAKDGVDGKSVTIEEVRPVLEQLVKDLPPAKDGIDGKSVSIEEVQPLIEQLVKAATPVRVVNVVEPGVVGEFLATPAGEQVLVNIVQRATASVVKDLPAPKDGVDGKSVTIDELRPVIDQVVKALPLPSLTVEDLRPVVEQAVKALPPAKDGVDGKSVTIEEVRPVLEQLVKDLPPAKDGIDGKDGTSVTEAQVKTLVDAAIQPVTASLTSHVEHLVKSLPAPKDGKDGVSLAEVLPAITEAIKSLPMPTPQPGKDGTSVTVDEVLAKLLPALTERIELAITKSVVDLERRAQDMVREAAKSIPVPKDGKDGLGFDDFDIEYDGERTIRLCFASSGVVKESALVLPIPLHRGIYDEKQKYERADEVTFGGSTWRAVKDAPTGKPGSSDESVTGWRLITKRGRDGLDFTQKKGS